MLHHMEERAAVPNGMQKERRDVVALTLKVFRWQNIQHPTPNIQLPTRHRVATCSMFDVGCSMLDVGCWMLDVGCSMSDVRCWMFDVGGSVSVESSNSDARFMEV